MLKFTRLVLALLEFFTNFLGFLCCVGPEELYGFYSQSKSVINQANLCSKFVKARRVEGEEMSQEPAGITYPCQPVLPQGWDYHQNLALKYYLVLPHYFH